MVERQVTLTNPTGLHARPAALFAQTAGRFKGTAIRISRGDREADAKSILGIMSLGAARGSQVTIKAEGEQAAEAVDALEALIQGGFGEN